MTEKGTNNRQTNNGSKTTSHNSIERLRHGGCGPGEKCYPHVTVGLNGSIQTSFATKTMFSSSHRILVTFTLPIVFTEICLGM